MVMAATSAILLKNQISSSLCLLTAYDSTGSYISSDYQLLTSEARDNWQQLKLEYTAGQDGYVEVFTANESGQDAYFDDLLLTTHAAMQVQENHYDP
jgi:hypothetical protein